MKKHKKHSHGGRRRRKHARRRSLGSHLGSAPSLRVSRRKSQGSRRRGKANLGNIQRVGLSLVKEFALIGAGILGARAVGQLVLNQQPSLQMGVGSLIGAAVVGAGGIMAKMIPISKGAVIAGLMDGVMPLIVQEVGKKDPTMAMALLSGPSLLLPSSRQEAGASSEQALFGDGNEIPNEGLGEDYGLPNEGLGDTFALI